MGTPYPSTRPSPRPTEKPTLFMIIPPSEPHIVEYLSRPLEGEGQRIGERIANQLQQHLLAKQEPKGNEKREKAPKKGIKNKSISRPTKKPTSFTMLPPSEPYIVEYHSSPSKGEEQQLGERISNQIQQFMGAKEEPKGGEKSKKANKSKPNQKKRQQNPKKKRRQKRKQMI